jgi:hypothetical protein
MIRGLPGSCCRGGRVGGRNASAREAPVAAGHPAAIPNRVMPAGAAAPTSGIACR